MFSVVGKPRRECEFPYDVSVHRFGFMKAFRTRNFYSFNFLWLHIYVSLWSFLIEQVVFNDCQTVFGLQFNWCSLGRRWLGLEVFGSWLTWLHPFPLLLGKYRFVLWRCLCAFQLSKLSDASIGNSDRLLLLLINFAHKIISHNGHGLRSCILSGLRFYYLP